MKRRTAKLLAFASIVYIGFLIFVRGFLPQDLSLPIPFLVVPLGLLVIILVGDLASRVTVPFNVPVPKPSKRFLGGDLRNLTRQVEVGSRASPSFFENVVLNRLRESLEEKVSLETGIEREKVRKIFADERLALGLLRENTLYRLLYSAPPPKGRARLKMLREAIGRIEAWKA